MKNGSDAFERALRDSLESYEVPYNSADWTQLEKELNKGNLGRKASASLLALLLGGTLAVSTAVYFVVTNGTGNGAGTSTTAVANDAAGSTGNAALLTEATTTPDQASGATTDQAQRTAPAIGSTNTGNTSTRNAGTSQATTAANTAATAPEPTPTKPSTGGSGVLEIAIRPSVLSGCPGASVEFAADNLPSDGTFLWNFGDGSFSRDAKPKHTFSKAGRFEVMLSHSSVGGGTIHNKPVSDVIVIHEVPEASFNLLKQEYENSIPSVHFENRSIGGQTYAWDFGDGSTSSISHPSHVYKKSGTYTVSLVVTNGAGCTDRMEKTLRIEDDYNLLAQKTFSPNGDGVEDTFIPDALKTLGVKFHMTVHNGTTGELVYETSDAQRPWNGRIGGRGEHCATGDYIWMVEMKDGEKLGGSYNGTISLVR